jgi:hypothetical protein
MEEKALQKTDEIIVPAIVDELSIDAVKIQIDKIQQLMKSVMKEGEHFGIIPGTSKPSLLKPGAEKLGFTFRLIPKFNITRYELPNNHREYEIRCTLERQQTGSFAGEGVGSCSTMEGKYRYRMANRNCPECEKEAIIKGKDEYGGGWVCFKKKGGCGAKFKDGDEKITSQFIGQIENPNIADTYNTVLKIAKKRAHVDAMITACAASDIFTQDMEDIAQNSQSGIKEKTPLNINNQYLLELIGADIGEYISAEEYGQGKEYYRKYQDESKALQKAIDHLKKKIADEEILKANVTDIDDEKVAEAVGMKDDKSTTEQERLDETAGKVFEEKTE